MRAFKSLNCVPALACLFFWSTPLWAQGQPIQPGQPSILVSLVQLLPMLGLLYLIFHLLVFRPQNTQARKQQELLGGLKVGQTVVTSSGLVAKVAGIEKEHVLLELGANVKARYEKGHIRKLFEGSPKAS